MTRVRARVVSLGGQGDGVTSSGHFVPYTAPGDEISFEADGERGRLTELLQPSPDRVPPPCPHFGICGACQVQHLKLEAYRAWKRGLAVHALSRAGIEAPIADLVPAQGAGRRRVTLHVEDGKAGYRAHRSHTLVPVEACPILAPALARAPSIARALAMAVPGQRFDALMTATQGGIDVTLKGALRGGRALYATLAALARAQSLARLTHDDEIVASLRTPSIAMGATATIVLPPGAFLQATAEAEETLAHLALEGIGRPRRIADLFCGAGPFALRAAPRAQVFAADSDAGAIAALRKAAAIPGFKPVIAERRDLYRRPLLPQELDGFDLVILDPPYDGAAAQVSELARSSVPVLSYVSCNPASFARDAKILIAGGYRLERVTPVDQFLYSADLELAGVFRKAG